MENCHSIENAIKNFASNIALLLENIVEDRLFIDFGNRIYSKRYDYDVNQADLLLIQRILADELFDQKLELLPMTIIDDSYAKTQNDYPFKGRICHSFKMINEQLQVIPLEIQIVKNDGHDNLMKIVEVVAHELIHQYDYLYGQAKLLLPIERRLKEINAQPNEHYDVHGIYFKTQMERINRQFDLAVEITYNEKNMNFMKNSNTKKPIEIIDSTTSLNENDKKKGELQAIAQYLSTAFANDGSVSIEMHDDGVRVWTI